MRNLVQFSVRHLLPYRLLSVALVLAALGTGLLMLDAGRRALGHPSFPAPQETQPSKPDVVVLTDGTTVEGTLLELTEERVVLKTGEGKRFYARKKVEKIQRSAASRLLDFYEKYHAKAKTEKEWRQLAAFCKKQRLHPEHRVCLRQLLEIDPADDEARLALGEARLKGKWLSEEEVAAKLKEGYELEDGKLTRRKGTTTVVEKEEIPSSIKLLPRTELTDREKLTLKRKRRTRLANAEKFLARIERERDGVEWIDRYKVKSERFFWIESNTTRALTEKYGLLMELIRAKLSEMFRSPVYRRIRAPVFIHRTQEDFMDTDWYGRWGGRGLGGYYMPSNQSIHTYHGTFGFTGTTYSVLAHEGTHYYQGLVLKGGFDNIPIWLIEGLAVYFGDGSKFDPKKGRITVGRIPRDRLSHIQEKMLRKRHTPVEKLVGMTRFRGFSGSHYADAWALIYFLVKSSKDGERLMKEYWARGLREKLTKKDFLELAEKYYDTVEELQNQYVDYVLKLRPPVAGEVQGEYFVCDLFQFEFKAPSPEWQFFEDLDDKKMVVGLILPGTSAEIRIYYENNMYAKSSADYFQDYLKLANHFDNLKHEKVKIAGLNGYKLTYVDTGKRSFGSLSIALGEDGEIIIGGDDDVDDEAAKKRKKKGPRNVVKYMLIQIDGVASVVCSSKKGEIDKYRDVFDKARENFGLLFTRRW